METPQQFSQKEYERLLQMWGSSNTYSQEGVEALKELMKYLASCGEKDEDKKSHLYSIRSHVWEELGKARLEIGLDALDRACHPLKRITEKIPWAKSHKKREETKEKRICIAQLDDLATMPESMLARL